MRSLLQSGLLAAVALLSAGEIVCAYPQTVPKQAEKWEIDGINAALEDPVSTVRTLALRKIELDSDVRWEGIKESLVVPHLKDLNRETKLAAIFALGAMQAKDQETALVALINDKNWMVQYAAIVALGTMRAKDQEAMLVTILKDEREPVDLRRAAASALGAMQAQDQEAMLVTILKDKNNDMDLRSTAASALGAMQANDQEALLVTLLKDKEEEPRVRAAAASALGAMQANDQEALLVTLLKDKDKERVYPKPRSEPDPRVSAASALGAMQANDQEALLVTLLKDKEEEPRVRAAAASALGAMQANDQEALLVTLLKDKEEGSDIRAAAASALVAMQAKDQKAALVTLLQNKDGRIDLQSVAASALAHLELLNIGMLPHLTDAYYYNHDRQAEVRFLCHYFFGGAPASELVLERIMFEPGEGNPQPVPIESVDEARKTLQAFHEVLPAHPEHSESAPYFEQQILQIAHEWKTSWTLADHDLFDSLSHQMSDDNAAALRGVIEVPWWEATLKKLWKVIAIQIVLWTLLLYFYPTSPQVQAFFFWNRWARKFFGLGYVDFCLTWIPFLRNRLLAPFRDELIADAKISEENLGDYFEDIQVRHGENSYPIAQAIPEVLGQIILEGESGLGKSIFLRRLVNKSVRATAYFPAENCDHGVFELIQLKLKGKAGDEAFLRSIIWSGGLSIVIDGLNEVTVETREKIRRFLDDFPKANVLLATQPLHWKRPPKANVYRILPLTDDRIQSFLESRYPTFTPPVALIENDYKDKCREYLQNILGNDQSEEDRSAARLVLSNPMDLTTAAQILVAGETPTLKNLQKQQFDTVDHYFRDTHPGQLFPLKQFSENVYQRLLLDEITLDSSQFFEPIQALSAHKMVLAQNEVDADGKPVRKWVFRHDKIRDFFLVQAFEGQQDERILEHMDDPRFRGVYLMLASQLPLEQANELRDAVVDRAAETKDHHLSDAVVEVLKSRRTQGPRKTPSPPRTTFFATSTKMPAINRAG